MLLPDKRTIKPLLEEQKYQSAKEGIALATKVDALRKELNQLTKNREEFLQGTVIEIEKATKIKSERLDSTQSQIKALELKRKELLKPLNAEWKEVKQKKDELEQYANDLAIKSLDLQFKKEEFLKRQNKILKQEKHNNLIQENFLRLLQEAQQEKSEAKKILIDAKANRDEIEEECADRLIQVSEKESQVEFEKKANENEIKDIEKRKKELSQKEAEFKAKYQTFLETLKYAK